MTDRLEISLLGEVNLSLDGVPLKGQLPRRAEALLAYLVCTGQPHSREALANLLWDEGSHSRLLGNLRMVLAHLRQKLGPYLAITRQTVAFDSNQPYRLDVADLEAGLAAARLPLSAEATGHLADTVSLYRGDFLEGFYLRDAQGFEEWQVLERERLRLQTITALERLVATYLSRGDTQAGLGQARRLLQLDPLHEEAHRHLMRLLAMSGQRSAAVAHYESCRHLLATELGVEPMAETTALYEQIKAEVVAGQAEDRPGPPGISPGTSPPPQIDWGEAPATGTLFGREAELARLEQWLLTDRCRLVSLLGMGGVGKTSLAAQLARSLTAQFEVVYWRSLLNAPLLAELLPGCLQFVSDSAQASPPETLDQQLAHLLHCLRQRRCLLILDNAESVMGERAGSFKPGYETYAQLLQQVAQAEHHSCLLLTSREKPQVVARLERDLPPVKTLNLRGVTDAAGQAILQETGLTLTDEAMTALVTRYSGNALALKLVSRTWQDLFEGDIEVSFNVETPIIDDIREVLDQQFTRLSPFERDILLWLAIEREEVPFETLAGTLVDCGPKGTLLAALQDLQRRSLLEKGRTGFTLQNVVMEYVTDQLIEQVCAELATAGLSETSPNHQPPAPAKSASISLLNSHALLKAQAKEYVRQSQIRLIVQPITERLRARWGQPRLIETLRQLLAQWRIQGPLLPGYAAGNILNLLLYLGVDLSGYDFSRLSVWQAHLRGAVLPAVNFSGADFRGSVFTDAFRAINAIEFSPTAGPDQLLAAGTSGGSIRLWRINDWQPVGLLTGHNGNIWSIAFSREGGLLASGGEDETVRVWEIASGRLLSTLLGHTHVIRTVAFNPAGTCLASGGYDNTVRLWDLATGQTRHILSEHSRVVSSVAFNPAGDTLASGSWDRTVRLWQADTGQLRHTLTGHERGITGLAFSPDGLLLASSSWDQTVRLWDVERGQLLHILTGHTRGVSCVAFSPDGTILVSGGEDTLIQVWEAHSGRLLRHLRGHTSWISSLAFNRNARDAGLILASSSWDQTARVWDVTTGQALHTLHGHTTQMRSLAFSPDGQHLASGGEDGAIRLWERSTGRVLAILEGHTDAVSGVAFSPDGQTLVSSSWDQTVRVWQVQSHQARFSLPGRTDDINVLALSPDGRLAACGCDNHTVWVWEVQTGRCVHTLDGHPDAVKAVAFSPDGRWLASGGSNQLVQLWDVASGDIIRTFPGGRTTVVFGIIKVDHPEIIWRSKS